MVSSASVQPRHQCSIPAVHQCSIPGELIKLLPCSTIDPLGFSTSKHNLTQMFRIACSTPGTISSLFSTISSPLAGIKPLLVSRFTTQNSGWNIHTNDLTNRYEITNEVTNDLIPSNDLTNQTQLMNQLTSKWHSM